jgi:hypothetical protein
MDEKTENIDKAQTSSPTNASFNEETRTGWIDLQIAKLDDLVHGKGDLPGQLEAFDRDTERFIERVFGPADRRLEVYKYAIAGEAERMVNLPEAAQEELAVDTAKKAIQQRRQVLLALRSELDEAEAKEEEALTGEDREDPPGMS